jgi:hypothetical protein
VITMASLTTTEAFWIFRPLRALEGASGTSRVTSNHGNHTTHKSAFNPGEERSSSKKLRNGGSMTMTGVVPVHLFHME